MKRLFNLCILSLALSQNWAVADEFKSDYRPKFSDTISASDLKNSEDVLLVDVRLKEDFVSDPELIPGAMYGDPETLDQWSRSISRDRPIVVYCVAGKWVSQKAATLLSEKGFEVRSLEGGLNAWRAQDNRVD